MQIEKPLQRHGGRLEKNETYCGSCFGAETVDYFISFSLLKFMSDIYVKFLTGCVGKCQWTSFEDLK